MQELKQEAEQLRQEVALSRQQVALTQQENQALRRQLDQAQRRLQTQSERVLQAQRQRDATLNELRRKSQQLAAAAAAPPPRAAPATPTPPRTPPVDTAEIQRLKRELVEQQRRVEQEKRQALALQEQANQQRAQLGLELVQLQQQWDRQAQAASQRQQELERELALRDQEVGSLRSQLDSAEQQLTERNRLLAEAEDQREAIRQALERARAQDTSGDEAAQAQIEELEQRLARQQAVIEEQRQAMEYLQDETERRFAQMTAEVRAAQEKAQELESESAFQARENQSLQQQVAYLQGQWESSRERLQERQQALENQRQALEEARQEQARRQAELERQQQQAASQDQEQIQALQRELQEREAQLRQREVDLRRAQRQVDDLQGQVTRREEELRRIEVQQQQVALAGPTIEILDPPVTLTRDGGGIVTLQSPVEQREIVGRVQAPNGLFLLTVNDRPYNADDNGLFRAQIPVTNPDNPVNITAVDELGQRSSVEFSLKAAFRSAAPSVVAQEPSPAPARPKPQVDFGRYYALVIGNNRYQDFPNLQTAVNDAEAVAGILRRRYGFETRVLIDADRYSILSALNEYRSKLTEKDNFLLYYAGHGELDRANDNGNWLPVDAEPDSTANWISNGQITDILNAMNAKHVMVIADSCYSGTLARSVTTSTEGGRSYEKLLAWLKAMVQARSRTVITSGGVKPVLDGGGGEHSLFAKHLLDVLERNQDLMEGPELYLAVAGQVKRRASQLNVDQDPLYAPIQYAGDEGAPFFFNPVN